MSCLSGESNRELAVLAVTTAAALAQEYSPEETARLAAFFTILGDTLALFSLGPEECKKEAAGGRLFVYSPRYSRISSIRFVVIS